jgi:DNA mismatch repair protein MSH6
VRCAATVDCLRSLALAALGTDVSTCRPIVLADSPTPLLDVRAMRHPCAGDLMSFIPNDTVLGGSGSGGGAAGKEGASAGDGVGPTTLLVTGPNMGGKSTLLRQVCLAVVLAQMGARVPADSMVFTPCDRVFTRLGASDRILAGQSTFMVELAEAATVLREATPKSLVIMDELGRGTSTFDGYAIAHSVLDWIARLGCRCLFATHYHMLTNEFAEHPSVATFMMNSVANQGSSDVTFLYQFVRGVCPKSYGMNVARMANIPERVVALAEAAAREFEEKSGWGRWKSRRLAEKVAEIIIGVEAGAV